MANTKGHTSFILFNECFYLLCASRGASRWGYDGIHCWIYGAHNLLMERGIHQIIEVMYNINVDKKYE